MRISDAASKLTQLTQPTTSIKSGQGEDFGKMMMDALKEVNSTQTDARNLQNDLMAGKPVEIHDVMIAMERAGTAMSLTMQVRNKVLEAYQEISRMQV